MALTTTMKKPAGPVYPYLDELDLRQITFSDVVVPKARAQTVDPDAVATAPSAAATAPSAAATAPSAAATAPSSAAATALPHQSSPFVYARYGVPADAKKGPPIRYRLRNPVPVPFDPYTLFIKDGTSLCRASDPSGKVFTSMSPDINERECAMLFAIQELYLKHVAQQRIFTVLFPGTKVDWHHPHCYQIVEQMVRMGFTRLLAGNKATPEEPPFKFGFTVYPRKWDSATRGYRGSQIANVTHVDKNPTTGEIVALHQQPGNIETIPKGSSILPAGCITKSWYGFGGGHGLINFMERCAVFCGNDEASSTDEDEVNPLAFLGLPNDMAVKTNAALLDVGPSGGDFKRQRATATEDEQRATATEEQRVEQRATVATNDEQRATGATIEEEQRVEQRATVATEEEEQRVEQRATVATEAQRAAVATPSSPTTVVGAGDATVVVGADASVVVGADAFEGDAPATAAVAAANHPVEPELD